MRGGLIIVGIVFWISVRFEFPEQMVRGSECEVSQSGRYLNGEYTSVFNGLVSVGGERHQTFSILKQLPFFYFATEFDTTRLEEFDEGSFSPLNCIDLSLTFTSLNVFDIHSITSMFLPKWSTNDRVLLQIAEEETNYLGAAQIIEAELDSDPSTERIVQFDQGNFRTYIFYESYGGHWQLLDQFSVWNGRWESVLDFSLPGFVGISHFGHGTGFSCRDVEYFSIENGRVVSNFTINAGCYNGLGGDYSNTWIVLETESQVMLVNSSEIFVECTVNMIAELHPLGTAETIRKDAVSYRLVRQANGQYLPDKKLNGFNSAFCEENCDSTYFFPEAFAYNELRNLKERGTSRQKTLLKDFVYNSTATFR